MKTLFIASGPITWASARLRCYWPAKHMEDADVITFSPDVFSASFSSNYDVYVFQKAFDKRLAAQAWAEGKRIFWDACDPLWWWSPNEVREIVSLCNGVILSSEALKADFDQFSRGAVPSYCVPDRLELDHYPRQRKHQEENPVRFVWFGMAQNRVALFGAIANLERLAANGYQIALTICDDHPENEWQLTNSFPVYYTRWSLDKENEIISSHDVALLPPYPGPWGTVKSNNKTLTAWACGLPVVTGLDYPYLERMVGETETRESQALLGMGRLRTQYQADQSAAELEAILCRS